MSKKISTTNEIQSLLEDLMKAEETRAAELKKRLDELTKQLSEKNVATGQTSVTLGADVTLHVGNNKFDKHISSNASYDDFVHNVKITLGAESEFVGYRDDQGRSILLRTNQDIKNMFSWYFAQEIPFIQVISIPTDEAKLIHKFSLRKETALKEGVAIFRCEATGPDSPLIFLSIPTNFNKDEGFNYLQGIFGQFASLMFVDDSEDIITVDSNESWEYCIETGAAMSKGGRFQLLLIQTAQ